MSLILSGTDGLSDVDGSAATPAIRGTDANTGIFFGTDIIGFSEGGVEAMRINASGNLQTIATISVGNATPSTSGAGITFPATQSASSDANTLDDYEEGTWTPTNGGNATYGGDVGGKYIKIGKQVTVWGKTQITLIGTGSTTRLSGLPFTSASDGLEGQGGVGYYAALAVSTIALHPVVDSGAASVKFNIVNASGTGLTTEGAAIFGNSTRLYFSCTYTATA